MENTYTYLNKPLTACQTTTTEYFGCIAGRVSSKAQLSKYGPEDQIDEAEEAAKEFPLGKLKLLHEYDVFLQESASGWNRQKWEAAMDFCFSLFKQGKIHVVLLPRVDRETRFMAGSFTKLVEMFRAGLLVYFGRERLLFNPENTRDFEQYVNEAMKAQYYIDVLKANTVPARYKAARKGKIPGAFGRYGACLGLRYDKQTKRMLHIPGLIEVAYEILIRYKKGESRRSITLDLQKRRVISTGGELIQRSAVYRVLSHAKVYAGVLKWGGIEIPGLVDPIITEEDANEVQQRLQWNKEKSHGFGKRKWATGRVFCGVCGRRYTLDAKKGCKCNANLSCSITHCDSPRIGWRALEKKIWDAVVFTLSNPVEVAAMILRQEDERETKAGQLKQAKQALENQLNELGKKRRLLSFQHENGGLTDEEYLSRLRSLTADEGRVNEMLQRMGEFSPQDEAHVNLNDLPDKLSKEEFEDFVQFFMKFCSFVKEELTSAVKKGSEDLKMELAETFNIRTVVHPDGETSFKLEVFIKLPIPDYTVRPWPSLQPTKDATVKIEAKPQLETVFAASEYCVFLPLLSPELSWRALDL